MVGVFYPLSGVLGYGFFVKNSWLFLNVMTVGHYRLSSCIKSFYLERFR